VLIVSNRQSNEDGTKLEKYYKNDRQLMQIFMTATKLTFTLLRSPILYSQLIIAICGLIARNKQE
jgi:hypothetical protein